MGPAKTDEVRDIAGKLGMLYSRSPMDYAYLKGWIHCLLYTQDGQCCRKGGKNDKKK